MPLFSQVNRILVKQFDDQSLIIDNFFSIINTFYGCSLTTQLKEKHRKLIKRTQESNSK